MILRPRVRRQAVQRSLQILFSIILIWTCYDIWAVRRAAHTQSQIPNPSFPSDQKIFIASLHWTDEIVLREHWISAIVQLAEDIGSPNVFISAYGSGSLDNTEAALRELEDELRTRGIPHAVVFDGATHQDEVSKAPAESGWIRMPATKSYRGYSTDYFTLSKDEWVPRRIPYLARLRNEVMRPLYEQQGKGIVYDKVLWLNDVVFTSNDVRTLLATRGGDYAAACALDFKKAPVFYDTFALRDAQGFAPLADTWPYFQSASSRNALKQSQPVPVASCWNGMLAFDAAPFYDAQQPLKFRGIPDDLAFSHLEGSESCLVHADNPLSAEKGVWINPNIRVGYDGIAYNLVNARKWPSSLEIVVGVWRNRFMRWLPLSNLYTSRRTVSRKEKKWKTQNPDREEKGAFCLIDEMQILLHNGWGHA
ncbi:hypothetical protein LTR62_002229 [Meristemomyces frigidus]|uniref:Polysaccharide export protein n=1 Tax=Meristemomyces frigidus TaxID=1508187 RepID=A0AAN7TKX2_9PEZI|nr:hypothetical protein LTR62_002229 [Meristemomyces frigidus]